jgi:hypothetical protein
LLPLLLPLLLLPFLLLPLLLPLLLLLPPAPPAACHKTALIREATLMKKFHHPAVLPLYAAFVAGRELWFVTPFMVRHIGGWGSQPGCSTGLGCSASPDSSRLLYSRITCHRHSSCPIQVLQLLDQA